MECPLHKRLLISRTVGLILILLSSAIYSDSNSGRIRVLPFNLLGWALLIHVSVCAPKWLCEVVFVFCCGSTAPVPICLPVAIVIIILDWLLALCTMCTAWMALGILMFFMQKRVYDKTVNFRAIFYCMMSMMAGASSGFAAYCSSEIVKTRLRQAAQQAAQAAQPAQQAVYDGTT
ncbi:unnamed protein product [Urochloa humidicola]